MHFPSHPPLMPNRLRSSARQRIAGVSVILSVAFACACSCWPGSNGRTAVALNALNLTLFVCYAVGQSDRRFAMLILSAGVFGLTELAADYLCVRHTDTLDYSIAGSAMILESPWWMPLSWGVVAVQVGIVGDAVIAGYGKLRGTLATASFGALLIPFYEEMAWGADWWRYRDCLMLSHTPIYIIVAELVIAGSLSLWGWAVLRTDSPVVALGLGAAAGVVTIVGGVIGWGTIEFLLRGVRPLP